MIQPSSIDVRLDRYFRLFDNHKYPYIDPAEDQPDLTRLVEVEPDEPFVLHPGEFVLGSIYETVTLPDDVAARVEGKSSLGRLGLLTHATAGFVDPGFSGHVTLEVSNVATLPIKAWPGMKVGQALLLPGVQPGREPLRLDEVRLALPGPARPHGQPRLQELPPHPGLSRGGRQRSARGPHRGAGGRRPTPGPAPRRGTARRLRAGPARRRVDVPVGRVRDDGAGAGSSSPRRTARASTRSSTASARNTPMRPPRSSRCPSSRPVPRTPRGSSRRSAPVSDRDSAPVTARR